MTEEEIVRRIAERDESGMEALLRQYGPLMHYVAAPILPDAQDREEIGQIREELRALGCPENVLDDLSAEEIAACAGATSSGRFPCRGMRSIRAATSPIPR